MCVSVCVCVCSEGPSVIRFPLSQRPSHGLKTECTLPTFSINLS